MTPGTRRLVSALMALGVVGGLLATVAPAQAADTPTPKGGDPGVGWSAYPLQTKNDKTLRTTFFFEAQAGSTLRDAIVLSNLTDARLPLDVYASDGYNATGGGAFGVQSKAAKPDDV